MVVVVDDVVVAVEAATLAAAIVAEVRGTDFTTVQVCTYIEAHFLLAGGFQGRGGGRGGGDSFGGRGGGDRGRGRGGH